MIDEVAQAAAGFAKSLESLCDHVDGSVEQVIRKACLDLYRMIIERTPVDTGRAKSNWMISTSHDDRDIDVGNDGLSVSEITSIIESEVSDFSFDVHDDVVIIYNNLEYIEGLENGSSAQAPAGMVAVSLAEFTGHFNQALAGIEGLAAT